LNLSDLPSRRVRLDGERDTLGLYLTGHPFEEFEQEVRPLVSGRRLAALVPKPRMNLTRFHGVFAPNSALRGIAGAGSACEGGLALECRTGREITENTSIRTPPGASLFARCHR
jgi:hypothetical protein